MSESLGVSKEQQLQAVLSNAGVFPNYHQQFLNEYAAITKTVSSEYALPDFHFYLIRAGAEGHYAAMHVNCLVREGRVLDLRLGINGEYLRHNMLTRKRFLRRKVAGIDYKWKLAHEYGHMLQLEVNPKRVIQSALRVREARGRGDNWYFLEESVERDAEAFALQMIKNQVGFWEKLLLPRYLVRRAQEFS